MDRGVGEFTEWDTSDWAFVCSGVPHGPVLGLLLFNIYTNDQDCGISSDIKFTDDTKIGRLMRSDNDDRALQEEINGVYDWSDRWVMHFNVNCSVASVGIMTHAITTVSNAVPGRSTSERDLNVYERLDLERRNHCSNARTTQIDSTV